MGSRARKRAASASAEKGWATRRRNIRRKAAQKGWRRRRARERRAAKVVDVLPQVRGWDRRRSFTDKQARSRVGYIWPDVRDELVARGEIEAVEPGKWRWVREKKTKAKWQRGLLKLYIHYQSSREFEIEFNDIVVPRGITDDSEKSKKLRKRLMARVESIVSQKDAMFAEFLGALPFSEKAAAFEKAKDVKASGVKWSSTIVRALNGKKVWQRSYGGGKVDAG